VKIAVAIAAAAVSFAAARGARTIANDMRTKETGSQPYAPSPGSAPYISLGYREATADLMYVRLRGYVGAPQANSEDIAGLCEAIVALDPRFGRIYDYCGQAMTLALLRGQTIEQSVFHRAIALLERGIEERPNDWRLQYLAAQIYMQDLKTDDPALRRQWDEKATLLVESAIRKPGAPANLAGLAVVMRTKFGQHERAVEGLRELILTTSDLGARKAMIERLAELEEQNADAVASELLEARRQFETEWKEARPFVSATWYVLLGPRSEPGFDMVSLATGGRDLATSEAPEALPPVE
jgi:hypothetical protein